MRVYWNFNDWWIGYYRGSEKHFVCFIPTLVICWERKKKITPRGPLTPEQEHLNALIEDMYIPVVREHLKQIKYPLSVFEGTSEGVITIKIKLMDKP